MRWLRSWPAVIPPHRAHVVDDLERLVIADYDYTPLGAIDDDVVLIEWDMALAPDDMEQFDRAAKYYHENPLVAPYKLYYVSNNGRDRPVWAHRKLTEAGEDWIRAWDNFADYVGFGLIYLPRRVVRAFLDAPAPERGAPLVAPGGYTDCRFHDQTFSMWYRHRYSGGGPIRVEWDIWPVHLHGREM